DDVTEVVDVLGSTAVVAAAETAEGAAEGSSTVPHEALRVGVDGPGIHLERADDPAGVVDARRVTVEVTRTGVEDGHAVDGVPQERKVVPCGAGDLAVFVDGRGGYIAQVDHTLDRVPEEATPRGRADHLAGVVDVYGAGVAGSSQRSEVDHEVVATVQVA